jgi:hypothetical protein
MTNPRDNAEGVKANDDSIPPDLGRDAIAGFQSAVHAHQGPYARPNHRRTTIGGGGFQTAVKPDGERSPFAGKPWQKDATND